MTDSYAEQLILEEFLNIKTVSNYARCYWEWNEKEDELKEIFKDKTFETPDGEFSVEDLDTFYTWYLYYPVMEDWHTEELDTVCDNVNKKILTTIQKFDNIGNIRSDLYPEVAVENVTFQHTDESEEHYWYEVWFLPSAPVQSELGTKGRSKWVGNIQVNVCVPKSYGIKASRERYDEIADYFKNGRILDGVRIYRTYRGKGVEDETCYTLPVTIEWHAFLDR